MEASFRQFFTTVIYIRFDDDDKHCDINYKIGLIIDTRFGELVDNFSTDDRRKISKRIKSIENRIYLWFYFTFSIIEQDPSRYRKRSTIEGLLSDLPI